jgi:hypothetical protein
MATSGDVPRRAQRGGQAPGGKVRRATGVHVQPRLRGCRLCRVPGTPGTPRGCRLVPHKVQRAHRG